MTINKKAPQNKGLGVLLRNIFLNGGLRTASYAQLAYGCGLHLCIAHRTKLYKKNNACGTFYNACGTITFFL